MARVAFYDACVARAAKSVRAYAHDFNTLLGNSEDYEGPANLREIDLPVAEIRFMAQGPMRVVDVGHFSNTSSVAPPYRTWHGPFGRRVGDSYYARNSAYIPLPIMRRTEENLAKVRATLPPQLRLFSLVASDRLDEWELAPIELATAHFVIWFDPEWYFRLALSLKEANPVLFDHYQLESMSHYYWGAPLGLPHWRFDLADPADAQLTVNTGHSNIYSGHHVRVVDSTYQDYDRSMPAEGFAGPTIGVERLLSMTTANTVMPVGQAYHEALTLPPNGFSDYHIFGPFNYLGHPNADRAFFKALGTYEDDDMGSLNRSLQPQQDASPRPEGRQVVLEDDEEPVSFFLQQNNWLAMRLTPDLAGFYPFEREVGEEDLLASPTLWLHHNPGEQLWRAIFVRPFTSRQTLEIAVRTSLLHAMQLREDELQRHTLRFFPPRGTPARVAHAYRNYPFLVSAISHALMTVKGRLGPFLAALEANDAYSYSGPKPKGTMMCSHAGYHGMRVDKSSRRTRQRNVLTALRRCSGAGPNGIPHDDMLTMQRVAMTVPTTRRIKLDDDEDIGEVVSGVSRSVDLEV